MSRQHLLLFGILICASLFSLVYATRQRSEANALASSRDQMRASLTDARAEIQELSSKVNALTEEAAKRPLPPPPADSPAGSAPLRRRPAPRPAIRPKAVEDPRWKRVESRLAEHQTELAQQRERIAQTQDQVRSTGEQLDGKISSTRSDLSRSIATNHDEVVALQKRGERNIYEFDLSKSKQFQRVGPLSLSLRKADTKHRSYDLSMMVDDKPVSKQHVNLFEPVWITLGDQPIQIVVNQIDKDHVRGYISEPRYKNADVAGAASNAGQAPALKSR